MNTPRTEHDFNKGRERYQRECINKPTYLPLSSGRGGANRLRFPLVCCIVILGLVVLIAVALICVMQLQDADVIRFSEVLS